MLRVLNNDRRRAGIIAQKTSCFFNRDRTKFEYLKFIKLSAFFNVFRAIFQKYENLCNVCYVAQKKDVRFFPPSERFGNSPRCGFSDVFPTFETFWVAKHVQVSVWLRFT